MESTLVQWSLLETDMLRGFHLDRRLALGVEIYALFRNLFEYFERWKLLLFKHRLQASEASLVELKYSPGCSDQGFQITN